MPIHEGAALNEYEQKQDARRARLLRAAERAETAANAALARANSAVAGIPFGQPILVGHHSEKRHRRALANHDAGMRRSVELSKLAQSLRDRANGVGDAGISADDPDAIEKLEDKALTLDQQRDEMKKANAFFKKHKTLEGAPVSERTIKAGLRNLAVWHGVNSVPFPAYALQNIGARIRQAKARATTIETQRARETTRETIGGVEVIDSVEEGRVMLKFPARLSKEDYKLVRSRGFLWSPSRDAFVRKSGNNALWIARQLAEQLGAGEGAR